MKLPFIRCAVTVTRAKRMEYFINLTLMHLRMHAVFVCICHVLVYYMETSFLQNSRQVLTLWHLDAM